MTFFFCKYDIQFLHNLIGVVALRLTDNLLAEKSGQTESLTGLEFWKGGMEGEGGGGMGNTLRKDHFK